MTQDRSHRRTKHLVAIPLNRIKVENNFINDDVFMNKYLLPHMKGQKNALLTRVESSRILNGFIIDGIVTSNAFDEGVNIFMQSIRSGSRPVVDVYTNFNKVSLPEFSCGDFENALAAYKRLGFERIPCLVHGSKATSLTEACVEIKANVQSFKIVTASRTQPDHVLSLKCENPKELFAAISHKIDSIDAKMEEFFIVESDLETGYNEVLKSILAGLREFVFSLDFLFENRKFNTCGVLIRSLFEILLNFYIDWLSPDHFGSALQFASAVGPSKANRRILDTKLRAKEILSDFERVFGTVEKKSRLSPLGSLFYDSVYRPLSSVVHQDYSFREKLIVGEDVLQSSNLIMAAKAPT